MTTLADSPVQALVDHLFRHEAGRMVATVTRLFGPAHLDLAEEVVQEAPERALKTWPFYGVPDDPRAWLWATSRHRAIDTVRRRTRLREMRGELETVLVRAVAAPAEPRFADEIAGEPGDNQLRLMFTCCHPALGVDARVALTLKTVCGFGVAEIAAAFIARQQTIAQRLVRAKRRIRELDVAYEVPAGPALAERLDAVLDVLMLMFNEGYLTHQGERLVAADLCLEAIRLARMLTATPATDTAEVHALLAFLLFQAARLPARADGQGDILLLGEQDRERWDRTLLEAGYGHLERAMAARALSAYHLLAEIAACHVSAANAAATDWRHILTLYDLLMRVRASPVVALNRAVALAMVDGPAAALAAIDAIKDDPSLGSYTFLASTRGELLLRLEDRAAAADCFRDALSSARNAAQRRWLMRKLARCDAA